MNKTKTYKMKLKIMISRKMCSFMSESVFLVLKVEFKTYLIEKEIDQFEGKVKVS